MKYWSFGLMSILIFITGKPGTARSLIVCTSMLVGWTFSLSALASPSLNFDEKTEFTSLTTTILVSPTIATMQTTETTSELLGEADHKVLLQARDDAATFVASDGEHRGVFLQAVLDVLNIHGMQQSDMKLAALMLKVSLYRELGRSHMD